jgi:hypothetical protein
LLLLPTRPFTSQHRASLPAHLYGVWPQREIYLTETCMCMYDAKIIMPRRRAPASRIKANSLITSSVVGITPRQFPHSRRRPGRHLCGPILGNCIKNRLLVIANSAASLLLPALRKSKRLPAIGFGSGPFLLWCGRTAAAKSHPSRLAEVALRLFPQTRKQTARLQGIVRYD